MKEYYGIRYLEPTEVCERLGISASTLKRWRNSGKIQHVVLSERIILYPETSVKSILNEAIGHHIKKEQDMNIVQLNDGNIIFKGSVYVKGFSIAAKMGITLESLQRVPNIRAIVGPDGQRYYHKDDVSKLFIEGKRKVYPNKNQLNG